MYAALGTTSRTQEDIEEFTRTSSGSLGASYGTNTADDLVVGVDVGRIKERCSRTQGLHQ